MPTGAGQAKLILVGEHWVLDGAVALALALPGLVTRVSVKASETLAFEPSLANDQAQAMLRLALTQVGWTGGVTAGATSTVPIRRGLGSSAALAVAMVRACHGLQEAAPLGPDETVLRARELEALVHGRSSGLDPAAAASFGAGVLFRSGVAEPLGRVHDAAGGHCWLLVDVGQGRPTREAIERAQCARDAMDPALRRRLAEQTSQAAQEGARALQHGDIPILSRAIDAAGAALEPLDIVDELMQACLGRLRRSGALAAKSSGAGLGGVLFGLFPDAASARAATAACSDLARDSWIVGLRTSEGLP